MQVYLVGASQGQYEDEEEWIVCGYKEESLAKQHVQSANFFVSERKEKLEKLPFGSYKKRDKIESKKNPFDDTTKKTGIRINYLGDINYYVFSVDILSALPKG